MASQTEVAKLIYGGCYLSDEFLQCRRCKALLFGHTKRCTRSDGIKLSSSSVRCKVSEHELIEERFVCDVIAKINKLLNDSPRAPSSPLSASADALSRSISLNPVIHFLHCLFIIPRHFPSIHLNSAFSSLFIHISIAACRSSINLSAFIAFCSKNHPALKFIFLGMISFFRYHLDLIKFELSLIILIVYSMLRAIATSATLTNSASFISGTKFVIILSCSLPLIRDKFYLTRQIGRTFHVHC